jgi:hypothetical protein
MNLTAQSIDFQVRQHVYSTRIFNPVKVKSGQAVETQTLYVRREKAMASEWPLSRIVSKVQDDLDLHEENFVTTDDIKQFIEDAIDDAEEIIIDCFSDFFLTYADLTVEEGDETIDLPEDLYESRLRRVFFSENGYDADNMGDSYKLGKIDLDEITNVSANDSYRYRLVNTTSLGQAIYIYPPIRESSSNQFRVWYIRQAKRLEDDEDVLEKGLRIQYILAHVKKSVLEKIGDPLVEVWSKRLDKQEDKLKNSLSRLTDDDEDVYLEPDMRALQEAYGDEF